MKARKLLLVVAWVLLALPLWLVVFLNSETDTVLASHDVVVSPTLDHRIHLEMGPYLPDLRAESPQRVGVRIVLGKTDAATAEDLVDRYALLASRSDIEIHQVESEVRRLAVVAAVRAGAMAMVPLVVWVLLGDRRRRELLAAVRRPSLRGSAVFAGCLVVVLVASTQPWREGPTPVRPTRWISLSQAVPGVHVPDELSGIQVQAGLFTDNTRRFVVSALDSYDRSKVFFERLVDAAPDLKGLLHEPAEDETVAVLVSDRHDNIGMDPVVRAVAAEAGATVVIDAGDDTSTGEPWESFSLDSLDRAFGEYDGRFMVAGNHDHGSFVSKHLARLGWTHLDGEPVTGPGDIRFFGVDDPRSSGLGSWRDETGLSFAEVEQRVADAVCELDDKGERVASLVVHDANLGRTALARGCVDLVLAGHLHVQVGPDRVVGENGRAGYTYTNGTTGGAAYAIAIASKLRREAEFTFVTYRDGRPVGIQPVKISPRGQFTVEPYVVLDLGGPASVGPPSSSKADQSDQTE